MSAIFYLSLEGFSKGAMTHGLLLICATLLSYLIIDVLVAWGKEKINPAVDREARCSFSHRLDRTFSHLKMIAKIAPLIGLLGTISGMIEVFDQAALNNSFAIEYISEGISLAMVSTKIGLTLTLVSLFTLLLMRFIFQKKRVSSVGEIHA